MRLVVATRNRAKFHEIAEFLRAGHSWRPPLTEVQPLWVFPNLPEIEEKHPTFRENALEKARIISRLAHEWVLADDSGLVVDALGGRPGVFSARYAGEGATDKENLEKLLFEMKDVPDSQRGAHYACVLALVSPTAKEWVIEESVSGVISREPRGEQGFGYDPVFFLSGLGKRFSEIPLAEKNRISHRGKALKRLLELLSTLPST